MNDTEEQIFKIPIDSLFEEFKNHIDIKNNSRIVFSGKFGTGKTYFLNEFFKDETNEKEYEVFHLYPVNYQISQNEDIIELLKYDISVELFEKELFKDDDEHDKSFVAFIKEKWDTKAVLNGVIENTIELLPTVMNIPFNKLGRPLKDLLKLDESLQKFKKSSKKEIINEFLKENNSETDVISQIIKHEIVNLEKKSVLILDDLDRIDPEHIFRILNVFSAYFDQNNEEFSNKFGFDKIILVADVKNIKSIFYHKYGEKADFNGYFDKFFNSKVFEFDNRKIIYEAVENILLNIKHKDIEKYLQKNIVRELLIEVLTEALSLDDTVITLRQLLKGVKIEVPINSHADLSFDRYYFEGYSENKEYINFVFELLKYIINSFEPNAIVTILKKIQKNSENDEIHFRSGLLSFFVNALANEHSEKNDWIEKVDNNKYSVNIKTFKEDYFKKPSMRTKGFFYGLIIEYIEREKNYKAIKQ